MSEISILTDLHPYRDRWHAQRQTTERMAELFRDWGHSVRIESVLAACLEPRPDLVVVNITGRGGVADEQLDLHEAEWARWRQEGGSTLGIHASVIAFRDAPSWAGLLGGDWIPGASGHPQIGRSLIHIHHDHEVSSALADFTLYDERYSRLEIDVSSVPIASHVEDGERHVLAWARVDEFGGRVVYDGLGHGVESFDSVPRVALLRREVEWLLGVEGRA